jgi:hypothetical protein
LRRVGSEWVGDRPEKESANWISVSSPYVLPGPSGQRFATDHLESYSHHHTAS